MTKFETPGMKFELFIDEYIKRSGKSISKVAAETHIPADSLRKYIRGDHMINLQFVFVLCSYFHCEVYDLIHYEYKKHNNQIDKSNYNLLEVHDSLYKIK